MLEAIIDKWGRHLLVLWGVSPKTVKAYVPKVYEFIGWLKACDRFSGLDEVERKDIEDFLEYLFYTRRNSNQTRATKLIALTRFWRFLVYEEIAEKDITKEIPRPRMRRKFVQDFTKEEILKFFKQCDIYTEKGLRDATILMLLAFCGLRVGEICNMKLNNVRDDGEYVQVQLFEDIVKQQSFRTAELWKVPSVIFRQWYSIRLSQQAKGQDLLFVSYKNGGRVAGNPLFGKDIDRLIKKLAERANIRKASVHAHMFRASFGATLRHVQGYDIVAISTAMGHKNISTTDKYLPKRGRVIKQYRSLREYWREFENIW